MGLGAYRSFSGARLYARATAIVYGLLTIMGLIPGLNTVFGLLPLHGHDVWLHALLAIIAAYFGFARPREVETGERVDRTTVSATPSRRS